MRGRSSISTAIAWMSALAASACGNSQPLASSGGGALPPPQISGLPPNGPGFMYLPAPDIPQFQNRDPRFRAPVELTSGTERYIGGEYQYTDFVYDDNAATYPDESDSSSPSWERYGGNAADLFELRLSTRDPDSLAVRFTLNTLMVPDSTIVALAFDSDDDPGTGSSTLPLDPGMPFPGTDQVLTTWGTGAEWSRWNGVSWDTTPLDVATDLEANQITVSVPKSLIDPRGRWRATLATGLYDVETGGWMALATSTGLPIAGPLPAGSGAGPKIINLGFRFNEVLPAPPRGTADLGSGNPATQQQAALSAGQPTRFANLIDFDLLRSRGARDDVPTHGMMYRVFASRLPVVMVSTDGTPENGNPRLLGEGKDLSSVHGRFLSPIQPYALYVPSGYVPGEPVPLTFSLHGDGGDYHWLNDGSSAAPKQLGEDRNSIVLSPAGRGNSGFYVGYHEYDVLEAWADVARHFTLDPRRTAITGYSMGGHGSYRLALLHPHLFARAVPMAPAACRGLWLITTCTTTEDTVLARWTENARNLPIFHIADGLSEITFYPGQAQLTIGPEINDYHSLDSLGYRYKFWTVVADHLFMGTNHPQVSEFLAQNEIEPEPFHVTYARMPSNDLPEAGLLHDRAYWLSGIAVRDAGGPLAKGVIDAVSLGFGRSDPASMQTFDTGVTGGLGDVGVLIFPYVETQRVWDEPGTVPVENRIVIKATNIGSVTIDPAGARVDCDAQLDVESDGPIEVKLLGCP